MLKHRHNGQTRLITQPDHADLSGYLAAHWGNEDFTRPGHFVAHPAPATLRAAVVFAVTHHDNGWWESEADPELDPADQLPLHFIQGDRDQAAARWVRGAERFADSRPFESLLISLHADWLHRVRLERDCDPCLHHPIYGSDPPRVDPASAEARQITQFLSGREAFRRSVEPRIADSALGPSALADDSLLPNFRLLQILDSLSLLIGAGGDSPARLVDVPRSSWADRTEIEITPKGSGRLTLDPYPFDLDPLPVSLPARSLPDGDAVHKPWVLRRHDVLPLLLELEISAGS